MVSTSITAARPPGSDIFTDFKLIDYIFVLLLYILLLYTILQISLAVFRPGDFDFDFMPIVNGSSFIGVIWGAARLDRHMRTFFRQIDAGRVVPFESVEERERALASIQAMAKRYGWIGALVLGLSIVGGIVSYVGLLSGAQIDWAAKSFRSPESDDTIPFLDATLITVVSVPVGALAGRFLGQMVANGRLLEQLHDLGYDLSSFLGTRGTAALNTIEAIYAYAAKATIVLCAVLGSWWIAFELNLSSTSDYTAWKLPFAWLWGISLMSFVFAAYRPVVAFQQRLSQIYGGQEALRHVRTQLDLAREDRSAYWARLAAASEPRERKRLQRRLEDLDDFIGALEIRTFRRPLLNRTVLRLWLLINAVAFAGPLLFALTFGRPVVSNRSVEAPQFQQNQTPQTRQSQRQDQNNAFVGQPVGDVVRTKPAGNQAR